MSRHNYALAPEFADSEAAIARRYESLLTDPNLLETLRTTRPREFDDLVWSAAETIYENSGDDE